MTELQPKLIYVAQRHPRLQPHEFTARWRAHGALGMSLPRWKNVARYVHCDVLAAPQYAGVLDTTHDGIGIVWHRSPAARAAHLADTSSRESMERDEEETFARPIVDCCILMHERLLLTPRSGSQAFKLTRLVTAAGPRELQAAAMRERLGRAGIALQGHVVNMPLPPENGVRWGLDVDCIEELWFDSMDGALRAAMLLAADGSAQILTNEVELYRL